MTTRITIVNHEECAHAVELNFSGQTHVIEPGASFTTHIWAQSGMVILELPIVNTPGVPVPDGFLGLTPIQFKAKRMYDAYSSNHPTMHCNRFAAWEELSTDEQYGWIVKAGQL